MVVLAFVIVSLSPGEPSNGPLAPPTLSQEGSGTGGGPGHVLVDSVPNDPKPSLRNDRHGLLRGLPEADVVAAGRGQELVDQRCEVLLRAESREGRRKLFSS